MFNKAKWIWKSNTFVKNSYSWFFKYITLDEEVQAATLKISAHNHFKLMINGKIVSGFVSPAPSVVDKEKLYLSYPIQKYLKKGVNKIEVIVLYLGGSGQNYINGQPGFILESLIKTKTKEIELFSDESFLVYENIPYKDDMEFQQSRRITPVQYYDDSVVLDDLCSHQAKSIKGYESYSLQEIPEGGIHKDIQPTLLYQDKNVNIYDCGEIISGFVSIEGLVNAAQTVTIRYSEDLENKRVKHNVANEHSDSYKDVFKLQKDKKSKLCADFTYKAFRYFEVEGDFIELNVIAHKAGTAIDIKGMLSSNTNEEINKLFTLFDNTQKNNVLGLLVDCPHREQAQYLGDSALQAESIIYNVIQRKSLIEKVISDFANAQYNDGTFPFVSPGSTNHKDYGLKIPEYDLYFVELIYIRFLIDMDKKIYEKYEHQLIKLLEQYIEKIDQSGLVRKNEDWHISDWPYPTVDQSGKYLAFENMLLYKSLEMFLAMTTSHEKSDRYLEIKDGLKKAIINKFKKGYLFKDCEDSSNFHQGIQAYALSCDLVDASDIDNVINYIIKQKMSSSIILGRTVIEMLFKYQKAEEALTYIFDYEKGWGHIIKEKSLTMWEGFDDIESHSHAWGMYPVKMIQAYMIGISFDSNEKNKIYVRPQISKRVKHLKAQVVSELGLITFSYQIKEDEVEFNYTIPKGLHANFKYNKIEKVLNGSNKIIVKL